MEPEDRYVPALILGVAVVVVAIATMLEILLLT
jgi:hypothetical protein